jgi:hypothetical protein
MGTAQQALNLAMIEWQFSDNQNGVVLIAADLG